VLEIIGVPAFPVWIPKIALLGVILREDGDAMEVSAAIEVDLEGKHLVQTKIPVAFHNGPVATMIFNLAGLQLNTTGELVFTVSIPDIPPCSLKIPVTLS